MKNKTLVISGATKGIGRATAYKFASKGVNIAFTYNSNEEIANEYGFELRKLSSSHGIRWAAAQVNTLVHTRVMPHPHIHTPIAAALC